MVGGAYRPGSMDTGPWGSSRRVSALFGEHSGAMGGFCPGQGCEVAVRLGQGWGTPSGDGPRNGASRGRVEPSAHGGTSISGRGALAP